MWHRLVDKRYQSCHAIAFRWQLPLYRFNFQKSRAQRSSRTKLHNRLPLLMDAIYIQIKRYTITHYGFFLSWESGVNDLVEEAIVSTKSIWRTSANFCAKLWPQLIFENQANEHCAGLWLMDWRLFWAAESDLAGRCGSCINHLKIQFKNHSLHDTYGSTFYWHVVSPIKFHVTFSLSQ